MAKKETVGKTLGVVVGLCLVCAIVVATASVQLRPLQKASKSADIQRNILSVAGVNDVTDVAKTFAERIESRVVNMETGEFVDEDAATFDFEATKFDAKRSFKLDKADDKAGVLRMTYNSPVYFARTAEGKIDAVILPIQGYGLWGIMYGFLALEADGVTVKSIIFFKHSETPGLGGEIQNPKWTATWVGKSLPLDVVKSGAEGNQHKVDGLSGATLTSNGVDHTVDFWTSDKAFGPFLAKLRKGELN
ncbi:Na(+)-translocating NADH-quinone reductase subunit C [Pseudoalteromonas fenneropenaei]|uniref:Na(+)-translocating NADH-quinone reductase subunit C n=1 Tax=Pseudoalteromonas fenneropenaei TaxID=1737459 RepID=A0ABV7CLQ3_9GAMM